MDSILKFNGVKKAYRSGDSTIHILSDVSFVLRPGQTAAVLGPSGSGKTTLLSIAAGLEKVDKGEVELCEKPLPALSEEQRAELRSSEIGFVFQNFELIPTLTALENVMVPAELVGNSAALSDAKQRLKEVGLTERLRHLPSQLSGGEQQRVAIARAFVNCPRVLFADEPTGNLDRKSAERAADLLFTLNVEHGTALLVATHDLDLAERCQRVFEFGENGELSEKVLA